MPRALLLCEYPTLSGGETSMLSTLDALAEAGFEIRVAAPPAGALGEELAQRGVPTVPFETQSGAGTRLPLADLRLRLRALIEQQSPDLLHANSLAMGRVSGPVIRELRLPSVAHLRDILNLTSAAVADLNCHTRLLAVSRAARDFHVAQGLLPHKAVVVHNGVDLERFRPRAATGDLHRELGLPAHARLVGTIGQISLRKGLDVLLAAAGRIASRAPDVHFLIVGARLSQKEETIRLETELRRQASARELAGRVHFLGIRRDVDRLLGELTLLVHPARQEPLGRVLLEAAAAGLAIVTTEVGGTPEIFPPESEAACCVPPNEEQPLAEAMLDLLADDPKRRRLALAARRRVEAAFDARQTAAALVEQYRQVLAPELSERH